MSKFADRLNRALMVIDVQNDVVVKAWRRNEIVGNINNAVTKARGANIPVIWVQHSDDYLSIDSDGWQIVPELVPLASEPIIRKLYRSSFEETDLEETLANLRVGHLFISGAESNNCVRHTSHSAFERGYDVTLIEDGHTTTGFDWDSGPILPSVVIDEQNANFTKYGMPGRSASVVSSIELSF
jgi:nicotinamidase-related amidase